MTPTRERSQAGTAALVCQDFSVALTDAADIPEQLLLWPFNAQHYGPWIGKTRFPWPRPEGWRQPVGVQLEGCALKIGQQMVPLLVLMYPE